MNIIIVDDQDIMLQGMSMIVSKDRDIQVVGLGANGQEALELCQRHRVDVVVMDIRMPVMNGVEATRLIKEQHPDTKVLILTTFKDDEFIIGSLKNGASGYLLKDASPEEIINGIKTVFEGGTLMNAEVASKVVQHLSDTQASPMHQDRRIEALTKRELDICHHLGEGLNNREIGEILYISEGTVKNNITRVLDKLTLRDRTQLALFSVKNGL